MLLIFNEKVYFYAPNLKLKWLIEKKQILVYKYLALTRHLRKIETINAVLLRIGYQNKKMQYDRN